MIRHLAFACCLSLSLSGACSSDSPSLCGSGDHYTDGAGAYCAYVVVRGGFECPDGFPHRLDLPSGGVVCSDHGPISRADLPVEVCRTLDCFGADAGADAMSDGPETDAGTSDVATDVVRPACDALEPAVLEGGTPFGEASLSLESLALGDCITITVGTVEFSGVSGSIETLSLQFSYDVDSGFPGPRSISSMVGEDVVISDGTMSVPARLEIQPRLWQEGADGEPHAIDATLNITGDGFSLSAIQVVGTFCTWQTLLC